MTDPPGLQLIKACTDKAAFHPHSDSEPIYTVRHLILSFRALLICSVSCRTQTVGMFICLRYMIHSRSLIYVNVLPPCVAQSLHCTRNPLYTLLAHFLGQSFFSTKDTLRIHTSSSELPPMLCFPCPRSCRCVLLY